MTAKKTLQLVLRVSLTVLFCYLILRQISFEEIRKAFAGTHLIYVTAALAAFAVGYSCRIERWRLMLVGVNACVKWRCCAGPLLASFAVNNVLPLRAGDLMRTFAFNRQLGTTSGVVVATLFVERLLDFLIVLGLLSATLNVFSLDAHRFVEVGSIVLVFAAIAILLLLLFPHFLAPSVLTLGRLIAGIAPQWGGKLLDELTKSMTTLQHLSQKNTMFKLVAWSLLAWMAEGCVFWFAALALPSIVVPRAAWLALPVGTLATLIPSTPGYVGTFDFFTFQAMTTLGNASGAATAYALLVHALLWLPLTFAGGLYLLIHPVKISDDVRAIGS